MTFDDRQNSTIQKAYFRLVRLIPPFRLSNFKARNSYTAFQHVTADIAKLKSFFSPSEFGRLNCLTKSLPTYVRTWWCGKRHCYQSADSSFWCFFRLSNLHYESIMNSNSRLEILRKIHQVNKTHNNGTQSQVLADTRCVIGGVYNATSNYIYVRGL